MGEHCDGLKSEGEFVHTLTLTDIASGWTRPAVQLTLSTSVGLKAPVAQPCGFRSFEPYVGELHVRFLGEAAFHRLTEACRSDPGSSRFY